MEASSTATTSNIGVPSSGHSGDNQTPRGGPRRGGPRGFRGGANRGRRRNGPPGGKTSEVDQPQNAPQASSSVRTEVSSTDAKAAENKSPTTVGDDEETSGRDCFICANTVL